MSSRSSAPKLLAVLAMAGASPWLAHAQVSFSTQGDEYRIIGGRQGDQVLAQAALNPNGGYLVWQDNFTDGDGTGISAQRLNGSLSGTFGVFRVNESAAGDQALPQTALLTGGGAVFAWQSTMGAGTKVIARFLKSDGTFASGDVTVSSFASEQQITPVVAGLADGNALVVWASSGQDGSMLGVFGQRFSPSGTKIGTEFQINQNALYNQRTPALVALPNGNVVVVWVTESTGPVVSGLQMFNVDIAGRIFNPAGAAVSSEFKVNSSAVISANPSVSASADGFLVAWSGKPGGVRVAESKGNGWDIFARAFDIEGRAKQSDFKVNSYTFGDQFAPKAGYANGLEFVLWTSLAQDGDREGVIGRVLSGNGDIGSREFRVNSTTVASQVYPTVVGNGGQEFLCIWSGFVGGAASFDLFAQRYSVSVAPALGAPAAPAVSALSQSRLSAAWPELAGYTGVQYLLFIDGSSTPVAVSNNQYIVTGLAASTSHSFRLAYKLADGQQSALSEAATAQTWGDDGNFDGLPDDWQARHWGADQASWPAANIDSDNDGATNLQEFLAGTDPKDAQSVLRIRAAATAQGWRLEWNTEPGCVYQVQSAGEGLSWSNLGSNRFAAGKTDSIPLTGDTDVALYRIIRVR